MNAALSALLVLLVLLVPARAAEGWMTDLEAARQKALAEKKDLLLDFTGSDWCGWCQRLKKEVFDHQQFKDGVADQFILVELDFPRDKAKQDPDLRAQNEALAKAYGVEGFPTILLTDARGRPYGQTGYREGGPGPYLAHLAELREERIKRDTTLAQAATLEGVAKARALAELLEAYPDQTVDQFYQDLVKQLTAADPEDETGYQEARAFRKALDDYQDQVEALFVIQRYQQVLDQADTFLKNHQPEGEDRQRVLMAKVMAYAELHDEEKAVAALEEIREAAPDSDLAKDSLRLRTRISEYIAEKKKNPTPPPAIVPPPAGN